MYNMNWMQDRIRGCLIGGAAGDALGYSVEFMSYGQILSKYGPHGITRYDLADGVAQISDDTQMTLYTANGLLIDDIQAAYLEWYRTQIGEYSPTADAKCWISNLPALYSRRAPGCTCMSALQNIKCGVPVCNNSKGCGGIMRVAPIGIYGALHRWDLAKTARMACDAARMTHKHPLGWISAGEFAVVIQSLLELGEESYKVCLEDPNNLGDMLASCSLAVMAYLKTDVDDSKIKDLYMDFADGVSNALHLAGTDIKEADAIRQIGEGWTGEEAYYIAIYAMFKHLRNPEQAIIAAVNHSGDSDSTGAVTGNLVGALHGYDALPDHFKRNLELHDVILKMADDLYITQ